MSDTKEAIPTEELDSVESTESLGFSPQGWQQYSTTDYASHFSKFVDDGLFMDSNFPAGEIRSPRIEWRRPKDFCPSAQFIVDGATRMDVCQGVLNDCWFLSAVASLSLHRPLLERVVPVGQSFREGYNGRFSFRFWQYGKWEEVEVDDRLPTEKGKLVYMSSSDKDEFWSALLEKAYAKLKGGYQALNMGFPHEAMVDMTGGITDVLSVESLPRDVVAFLKPLLAKGALINCANCQGPLEENNGLGILYRHAYSVTGVNKVKTKYETLDLVRVRNPWGMREWEGPWSDMNGPEWSKVSEKEQLRLERVQKEDGEFWMAVSDFRQNFDLMEVCHLSMPTDKERMWESTMHHGNWVSNVSAGGSPKGGAFNRFWQNPQFHLTLLEEDDDPSDPELTCSFLVALMQKHQRRRGVPLAIHLDIYKARSNISYLSHQDLNVLRPLLSTEGYSPRREVVICGRLAPGHYIIIPSTAMTNQQGEFILRVWTEKGNAAIPAEKPSTEENPTIEPSSPHLSALPNLETTQQLFQKHCNQGTCRPLELHNLLTEVIKGGVLAGSEKHLSLEHCKSFVVLMDSQGLAEIDWQQFQALWAKIRKWTEIFLKFDRNKTQALEGREVKPALKAAGLRVDSFILQLIGLRYTEPDMTISYPGFLYLLMKLDTMIYKFKVFDMMGMGTISINYRQWLYMTMYN